MGALALVLLALVSPRPGPSMATGLWVPLEQVPEWLALWEPVRAPGLLRARELVLETQPATLAVPARVQVLAVAPAW